MAAADRPSFVEDRKDYWNRVYRRQEFWPSKKRNWLEAYESMLVSPAFILDMGCGTGISTEFFVSRGHSVIAVDISDVALEHLREKLPRVETRALDFTLGLPWQEGTFHAVIADLCLHYFDADTTKGVVQEIFRVLKYDGILLARVNSVKDTNFGYGKGELVEPDYFLIDGHYKRFFDRDSIKEIFGPFDLVVATEDRIDTGHGEKQLFEIVARKGDTRGTDRAGDTDRE
jgi:SAM-dependent methyltransferase